MALSLLCMNSLGLRVKHKFMVACTATFLIILLQNKSVHTVLCHVMLNIIKVFHNNIIIAQKVCWIKVYHTQLSYNTSFVAIDFD